MLAATVQPDMLDGLELSTELSTGEVGSTEHGVDLSTREADSAEPTGLSLDQRDADDNVAR